MFPLVTLVLALLPGQNLTSESPGSAAESIPNLSSHTVVFSVDDGYHSVFTNIYPLLRKYRMTMTLALIVDYVGPGKRPSYRPAARFMNQAEVQELIDSCGIEVASHSMSHPFLTRLDSTKAWTEISQSKQVLESLFGTEVITFVYPYGDMNTRIRRMTKQAGYRLGRAVVPGEPNLWLEPYRLPTLELRRETNLADVKRTIARRRTTILLLHQIVASPSSFTEWNLADFERLLEWMAATRVRVITLAQLYREWWFEKLGRMMQQMAAAYPDRRKQLLFEEVNVDATGTNYPR
ncbi:MAG: polysaccharide deacetylase family protein [candidate division WOR-3 bacterium]